MNIDLNQNPVLDDTIDDVSKTTDVLMKTKYRKWQVGLVALAITLSSIGLIEIAAGHKSSFMQILLGAGWLLLALFYSTVGSQVQHTFMQQFAKLNGYAYQQNGNMDGKIGYIFSKGHGHVILDYITGIYQNCPIEFFTYNYTEGEGKNSHTYLTSIFSIDFQIPVPHITLKKHEFIDFDWKLGEKIKLEGDFSDKFDLFVQKGFSVEALQIFTPDLMGKIENEWKFELEFIETKLYIYTDHEISRRVELQNLYDAVKYLASRLDPLLDKMKSDITAVMETNQ